MNSPTLILILLAVAVVSAIVSRAYFLRRIYRKLNYMLDALEAGEPDTLRTLFTSFLSSIPYTMRRKDDERERERYFQYTFYLILRLISVYTVYVEKQQSQGRVDCVLETPQYVYIFEFKLDGTADEALRQIEEKGYAREYA